MKTDKNIVVKYRFEIYE